MKKLSTTLKLVGGLMASTGALGAAVLLGGGHEGAASTPLLLLAGVSVGALLHIPGHFAMQLIEAASDGIEDRVEIMMQGGRPTSNEDALRAGRRCALSGVAAVTKRFVDRAKSDGEHDLALAMRLHKGVANWVRKEQQATKRRDRPDSGGWTREGFCLEAIERLEGCDPVRARELGNQAWMEFVEAMAAQIVVVPRTFRPYFDGEAHCGLGWREAGHLFLMHDLKTNHDGYVGYQLDKLNRMEMQLQTLVQEVALLRRHVPSGALMTSRKRKAPSALASRRPDRLAKQSEPNVGD